MGISRGTTATADVRLGTNPIDKVMRGATLIWQRTVGTTYLPETLAYRDRVVADGGTVVDMDYVNAIYQMMLGNNIYSDLLMWHSPYAGRKLSGSGTSYVRLYDLSANNIDLKERMSTDGTTGLGGGAPGANGGMVMAYGVWMLATKAIGLTGAPALTTIVVANADKNVIESGSYAYGVGDMVGGKTLSVWMQSSEKAARINGGSKLWGNDNALNTKQVSSMSIAAGAGINTTRLFVNKAERTAPTDATSTAVLNFQASAIASLGTLWKGTAQGWFEGTIWDTVTFKKDLTASGQRGLVEDVINTKALVY